MRRLSWRSVAFRPAGHLQFRQQFVVAGKCLGTGLTELVGHLLQRYRQREVVDHHVGAVAFLQHLVPGKAFGVAAEQDVDAAARHVGGHRDCMQPARLSDDHGLARVLLGVEHLVVDALLLQQPRR